MWSLEVDCADTVVEPWSEIYLLAGPVYTAQKPAEMSRQPHQQDSNRFDWQAIFR